MLTRLPNGDLELSVRPPLVYLDHWALRAISENPARRAHFLETFRDRGTLMVSLVNVLDMAQNSGRSYQEIRSLLDDVGPYWLLSDPDPETVHRRQARGIPPPLCFLAPLDVFGIVFKNLPEGTLRLGAALDALQDDAFRSRARALLKPASADGLLHLIEDGRKRHLAGEAMLPQQEVAGSPMWIIDSLLRYLVKDGKRIVQNDVVDLLHAAVPLGYAHVLLLDKAWANFAKKLKLPDTLLFDPSQVELGLEAMRSVDVSTFRVLRPATPLKISATDKL